MTRGYSALSPTNDKNAGIWRRVANGNELELSVIGNVENVEAIDEDIILEDLKVSPNFYFVSVLIGNDLRGPGSSPVHITVLLGLNDRAHFVHEVCSLFRDVTNQVDPNHSHIIIEIFVFPFFSDQCIERPMS